MSGHRLARLDVYKAVHGNAGKWGSASLEIFRDVQASLSIGDAAHKAFIEACLRTMTDIEIVSVPAMLNAKLTEC